MDKQLVKVISVILLLSADGARSVRTRTENRFDKLVGFDSILVTRCDAACHERKDKECHRTCMSAPFEKHGRCPDSFENLSTFVQACLVFCSNDVECPSTEKCCEHSCGSTCKPVVGLENDQDLPAIPENVTASKKKRGVFISWTAPRRDGGGGGGDLVLYVLQERHHLGPYFNERRLGEWYPIHSTSNTSVTLKGVLKPGHFYQFRVASVNANGSRGFSRVSKDFTVARLPRLQRPKNLRVEEIRENNGTVWGMVRWRPAKSPIPIDKYKILWSYKLDDNIYKYNSDSLITQRTTVPEHRQYYQLKDLMMNKMYYIQVQAIASYGQETLKSSKAQMILDTSKFENQYEMD